MHFTLFLISFFFVSTHSAPTAPLDPTTLLNNALEAQQLNAQFQSANGTATGSCNNGDTTCIQDTPASCLNGQFVAANSGCPTTEHCFALPSVKSNGTVIACTSEKSAQSLINAAGATGDVTGSGSGGSSSSISPASVSSTLNGTTPAVETAASMNADYSTVTTTIFVSTPTPTAVASDQSVVTKTVTLIATTLPPMIGTTLPSVTQTLSPEEAASFLSSLLAQSSLAAPTAGLAGSDEPSDAVSSTVSATATDIPSATPNSNSPSDEPSDALSSTASVSATNIPSPASPSITPVAIANNAGSPTSLGSGGYSGY